MRRRDFFRATLPVVIPSLINGVSLKALADSPFLRTVARGAGGDRVLVLIQLSGGNDGLNTVIPLEYYSAYHSARANIALPEDKVLRLQGFDGTGLHPAMPELQQLFNAGKLTIVQGVSYPQPNFSHFRATDIWLTGADASQILPTGWAGRYLDQQYPHFPQDYPNTVMPDPLAIQVGSLVSPALQGPALPMGMAISNPNSFYDLIDDKVETTADTRAGDQLAYIRQMAVKTDQYAGVIKKAAQKVTKQSDKYPAAGKNPLADQLKIVARLVAGGLKTRIYLVSMGGFDTHARQTDGTDTTTGAHARLLARLSEAINAFQDDLTYLQVGNRVMGMTFSEFGRRIQSNASGGTDHGVAAPVFVFGEGVQPGIIGVNPVIPDHLTVNDNLTMQTDFRAIYSSLLEKWFAADPAETAAVLLKNYPTIPLVGEKV
ncbi:DUF1501 domain-containing protein [Puia dinghuensis]|uniref:DUF1501 domain-containing protein n=1 Tax=Puia dinghuensis TaxID=1792502 RepID=A0A8J2U7J0_9BACT|nr:DUF1501 domain-containing protein [Puia dinghuensis]GGA83613.1 hypothetical protein GCM10011511_03410 [Puia dinghuensis]